MVLMSPEREMSPSSEELMFRVGSCTSAEESARMSGKLEREERVSNKESLPQTLSHNHRQSSGK